MSESTLAMVKVLLSGGCELLFGTSCLTLENVVPSGCTASQLVVLLKEHYVQQRPELFVDHQGDSPRPGILVLVNGCDIEVCGGMQYTVENGDEIDFISTLHGG